MHQQLGGSPGETADNFAAVLDALAGISIVSMAPSFDPPHVRVLVEDDVFQAAFDAMDAAKLSPTVHSAVTVKLTNDAGQLRAAMKVAAGMGLVVDAVLVVPNCDDSGAVFVSFGIYPAQMPNWSDQASAQLASNIEAQL
jgi:hypothetical protein